MNIELVKQGKEECHMRELKERIAFLQGLAEGLELKQDTGEGRILGGILEILDEMTTEIEELADDYEDLEEYVGAVDESLGDLEDDYYDDIEYKGDEDEEYIEVECPECGEIVYFEEGALDEDGETIVEITCPNCGAVVFSTEDDDFEYEDYDYDDEDYDEEEFDEDEDYDDDEDLDEGDEPEDDEVDF